MNLLDAAKRVIEAHKDGVGLQYEMNMLERAVAEIGEVMVDTEIVLNDEQWQSFQEMLNRPPQDKPKLAKLLREPSVLEARGIEDLIAEIDAIGSNFDCPDEQSWQNRIVYLEDLKAILDKYR